MLLSGACTNPYRNPPLPSSGELGSPRGNRIARAITHFHSPYSWDACDKNGRPDGKLNAECMEHLRWAMCHNRIDYLAITDHPDAMAHYEFQDLLLYQSGDEIGYKVGAEPYVNRMRNCSLGQETLAMVGFESRLLSMGMSKHLPGTPDVRGAAYGGGDFALREDLRITADAIVATPHTEQWTLADLKTLQPDAIEIYNIHANLDPKIRKRDLLLPPFETIPSVITYLIDPLGDLNPDFMFVGFVSVHPVYFQRWNGLAEEAVNNPGFPKVAGIGASDSHENVFKQTGSDGERLDAHRRLTRFMSNHVLVSSLDTNSVVAADAVKASLRQGKGWLVFEGFGSPVGMDFSADRSGTVIGPGESVALGGGSATIEVRLPSLHALTPGLRSAAEVSGLSPIEPGRTPRFRVELKRVTTGGADTVVASSENSGITFSTSTPGAYRAEIFMTPLHLNELLRPFEDLAENEYRWIITNHLYLAP